MQNGGGARDYEGFIHFLIKENTFFSTNYCSIFPTFFKRLKKLVSNVIKMSRYIK